MVGYPELVHARQHHLASPVRVHLRPWRESVVTMNFRFRMHNRLSSAHQTVDALRIHPPATTAQLGRDSPPT